MKVSLTNFSNSYTKLINEITSFKEIENNHKKINDKLELLYKEQLSVAHYLVRHYNKQILYTNKMESRISENDTSEDLHFPDKLFNIKTCAKPVTPSYRNISKNKLINKNNSFKTIVSKQKKFFTCISIKNKKNRRKNKIKIDSLKSNDYLGNNRKKSFTLVPSVVNSKFKFSSINKKRISRSNIIHQNIRKNNMTNQ